MDGADERDRELESAVTLTTCHLVRLALPATPIGRALLGAPDVSHEHAIFEWCGYELRIRNVSKNGTTLLKNGTWVRLPEGRPIELRVRDRLRFGGRAEGTFG